MTLPHGAKGRLCPLLHVSASRFCFTSSYSPVCSGGGRIGHGVPRLDAPQRDGGDFWAALVAAASHFCTGAATGARPGSGEPRSRRKGGSADCDLALLLFRKAPQKGRADGRVPPAAARYSEQGRPGDARSAEPRSGRTLLPRALSRGRPPRRCPPLCCRPRCGRGAGDGAVAWRQHRGRGTRRCSARRCNGPSGGWCRRLPHRVPAPLESPTGAGFAARPVPGSARRAVPGGEVPPLPRRAPARELLEPHLNCP